MIQRTLALAIFSFALAPALGAAGLGSPVSPGDSTRFVTAPGSCPTFSWTAERNSSSSEVVLLVSGVADHEAPGAKPWTLRQLLPAGSTSWTPAADQCPPPGRYAWGLLDPAASEGHDTADTLLFRVATPTASLEVSALIEALRALNPAERRRIVEIAASDLGPELPREGRGAAAGSPVAAVRGEAIDPNGENYGVLGISASPTGAGVRAANTAPAGPDLILDGAPPALLSESGLARSSAGATVFDFTNPGAGVLALRVDGINVVTTATDQDSLGGLSCAAGQIAQWTGAAWACAADAAGLGRSARGSDCLLDSGEEDCVTVALDMPRSGRVLIVASGRFGKQSGGELDLVTCYLTVDGSTLQIPHLTQMSWSSAAASVPDAFATTAVSNELPSGVHTLALHCIPQSGNPQVQWPTLSAVMVGAS